MIENVWKLSLGSRQPLTLIKWQVLKDYTCTKQTIYHIRNWTLWKYTRPSWPRPSWPRAELTQGPTWLQAELTRYRYSVRIIGSGLIWYIKLNRISGLYRSLTIVKNILYSTVLSSLIENIHRPTARWTSGRWRKTIRTSLVSATCLMSLREHLFIYLLALTRSILKLCQEGEFWGGKTTFSCVFD